MGQGRQGLCVRWPRRQANAGRPVRAPQPAGGAAFHVRTRLGRSPEQLASGAKVYNFETSGFGVEEAPGISVFYRDETGNIFHTYSCFARGLDMMNAAYHYLDLTPLGRHEEGLPYPMDWLRLRDAYKPASSTATGCQT